MKKFILGFFVAIMICGIAFSEMSFSDLERLSDADLLSLRDRVELETSKRGLTDGGVLYLGNYVVGEDLKSGSYTFMYSSHGEHEWLDVIVFESETIYNEWEENHHDPKLIVYSESLSNFGEGVHVRLKDGNYLIISGHYKDSVCVRVSSPFAP